MRKLLTALLLIAFGLVLGVGALELGLRVWFGQFGTEEQRVLYLYDMRTIADKTTQLTGVPYLNYSLNPAWDDINERGVRGDLVDIPKPDGVFRVVAVGGSTTFGHALDTDESWAAQLQTILRDEYGIPRAEVVNLGNPGYFSLDSVVNFATRGLAYQPDMVIVYHGVNDAVVRMYTDSACYLGDTPLHGFGMDRGIWQYDAQSLPASTLYRVLAYNAGAFENPAEFTHRMEHTGFCPPEVQNISPVDNLANHPPTYFARNLRTIAGTAAAHDVDVMLSTFAWHVAGAQASLDENPELYHTAALLTAIDEQNALVREIAAETDALLADFAADVDANPAYWQGDQVHQTAEGARAQAAYYAALLADTITAGG